MDYLRGTGRDFYHIALMDLFGLMEVDHPRPAVTPWRLAGVKHTLIGDALLSRLDQWWSAKGVNEWVKNPDGGIHLPAGPQFGAWQPLFQPYFPEWRNNLVLPQPAPRVGVFAFRVSLGKVWRTIAIRADHSLGDLVSAILRAFRFDSDHLYEFSYRDRFGAMAHAYHPFMDEGPWAGDIPIKNLSLEIGQSMTLTYDFGDNWQFDVRLERIEPAGSRSKGVRILESHGKAPEQYPRWDEEG